MARMRSRAGLASEVGARRVAPARVLVVEDDAGARDVLVEYLRVDGFDVDGAVTLEDAVAAIERELPVIVVADLRLGEHDTGVELAIRLRHSPSTRRVFLIAISSAVDPEWSVMRWFDAYLRKPIDFELLSDLVGRFAEAARDTRRVFADTGER